MAASAKEPMHFRGFPACDLMGLKSGSLCRKDIVAG
jgi:hypothetical protein